MLIKKEFKMLKKIVKKNNIKENMMIVFIKNILFIDLI